MFYRLEKILLSPPYKTLVENFLSLSFLQVANYIFPLITLPYLVRVIGVDKFGKISFAQAVVWYFVIFTTYGFNLYAPKTIAECRDNKEKLNNVFWQIFYSRFLMFIAGVITFFLLLIFVQKFRNDYLVFIFAFVYVLGDFLFPTWFFYGVEKMSYIALINFLTKIFYTIFIFIFIKKEVHFIFVPLFFSLSQVICGLISMYLVIYKFKLKPVLFDFIKIKEVLIESFPLFISTLSISIYTKFHVVILGFVGSDKYVGYYIAAEKLFQVWMGIQDKITTVVFPRISYIIHMFGKEKGIEFIRKTFALVLILSGSAFLFTFVFSKPIILLFYGKDFIPAVGVLKIFSLLFVILGIGYVLGSHTMLPLNMYKEFMRLTLISAIINLLLSLVLIPKFYYYGGVLSYFLSELSMSTMMFIILYSKNILIIPDFSFVIREFKKI
jgi:PST family polysaccharide transporter